MAHSNGSRWGDCNNGSRYSSSRSTECSQYSGQQSNKNYWFRFLTDERGSVIDFLIISTLVFFMLFVGVDYYTTLAQHQIAEHIMHYYLERVRVEGFLTISDESEMKAKFNATDLPVTSISCPRQSQGSARILRNPQNSDDSRITMAITCKPKTRPFLVGSLIGGASAPDSFRVKVGGSVLSERVDP
jgi:hypothetical protein